jgi:tetratricopeptide (TPR) repeat protein
MTSEQARLFADYILGMPDRNGAASYVQFSAFRLDDTFFKELGEMIREARKDKARKSSLEWLQSVASEATGKAYATFKAPARNVPEGDYERAKMMLDLDRRVTSMMMRTWFNPGNDSVITDWKNIVEGYHALIKAGPPKIGAYYDIGSLRRKAAQALESLARAYQSINDAENSHEYYMQAAKAFEEAGEPAAAAKWRQISGESRMTEEADFDGQIRTALEELENLDRKSPDYFSRLVDLGELDARAGDDFVAERTLLKAEAGLKASGMDNPSGSHLAQSLVSTLMAMDSGQSISPTAMIDKRLYMRGLHRRIYLGLADIYQRLNRKGDAKKAKERLAMAEDMDRSSPDDDFSNTMKGLSGDWGKLFR